MGLSAWPWRSGSSHALSFAEPVQCLVQFQAEQAEVALDAPRAADHHMVAAEKALGRHDFARERAEAPLHAVADDRSADLLCAGATDAHRGIALPAVADQQDESGRGRAPAGDRSEEIG